MALLSRTPTEKEESPAGDRRPNRNHELAASQKWDLNLPKKDFLEKMCLRKIKGVIGIKLQIYPNSTGRGGSSQEYSVTISHLKLKNCYNLWMREGTFHEEKFIHIFFFKKKRQLPVSNFSSSLLEQTIKIFLPKLNRLK